MQSHILEVLNAQCKKQEKPYRFIIVDGEIDLEIVEDCDEYLIQFEAMQVMFDVLVSVGKAANGV